MPERFLSAVDSPEAPNGTTADPIVVEILETLAGLARKINASSKNDLSTYYFRGQLVRYFLDLNLIRRCVPSGRMLDVGTFPSHLHECLLDLGYDVYGADLDPSRIQEELINAKKKTIAFNVESDAWPNEMLGSFDVILCLEVVEHFHINLLRFLENLHRSVKFGGHVLVSTPNLLSFSNRVKFVLGKQVLEHPLSVFEKYERQGHRGHLRLYSMREITDLLEVYGFTVKKCWFLRYESPLLPWSVYRNHLSPTFDADLFSSLWRENFSFKGRVRRRLVMAFDKTFPSLNNNLYVMAQKVRDFDREAFLKKLKEADPWADLEKLSYKVKSHGVAGGTDGP